MARVLALLTTTHALASSSSALATKRVLEHAHRAGNTTRALDVTKLHIVPNLSCYASGKRACAAHEAGPWRCWASKLSHDEPDKYGGADQLHRVYEAIEESDVVLFTTSVRWMSHSATMQTLIERMNTYENRVVSFGERSPLEGKRAGSIVTGLHFRAQEVGAHLQEVFGLIGFYAPRDAILSWQRTFDLNYEHDESDRSALAAYLATEAGQSQVRRFWERLMEDPPAPAPAPAPAPVRLAASLVWLKRRWQPCKAAQRGQRGPLVRLARGVVEAHQGDAELGG